MRITGVVCKVLEGRAQSRAIFRNTKPPRNVFALKTDEETFTLRATADTLDLESFLDKEVTLDGYRDGRFFAYYYKQKDEA